MSKIYRQSAAILVVGVCVHCVQAATTTYTDLPTFQSAAGPLLVDDFEGGAWLPLDSTQPQPTLSLGVSWTSSEELAVSTTAGTVSGVGGLVPRDIIPPDELDSLTAELPSGTFAVGTWIANAGEGNEVEMVALDSAGDVLVSVEAGIESLGQYEYRFVGITSTDEIDKVIIRSLQPVLPFDDDLIIDDFYFTVPEPGAVALFGLLMLPTIQRRRNQSR